MKSHKIFIFIVCLVGLFVSCGNVTGKKETLYNITIQEASNGRVRVDKSTGISAGEEVILSVAPNDSFVLKSLTVINALNKDVAVAAVEEGTSYKFTMPNSDVIVSAAFEKKGVIDITDPEDLNEMNGNIPYIIRHYKQDLDDTNCYTLYAEQKKMGNAGTQTTAVPKNYTGFDYVPFKQKIISDVGETVVDIYYNRKTITYTFEPNGGNWNGSTEAVIVSGLFGAEVPELPDPECPTFLFISWDKTDLQIYGAENQIVTALWDATENSTYTIKEYFQDVTDLNLYNLEHEYERTGLPSDFHPVFNTGFTSRIEPLYYDKDEQWVMRVYYDREKYTITFDTMGGSLIPSQQVPYEGKIQIPELPVKSGYAFYDWDCYRNNNYISRFDIHGPVTMDMTIIALWMTDTITYKFHDTVERLTGSDKDGALGPDAEYVMFGDYPQSLLTDENVIVDEDLIAEMHNGRILYGGSDGNLYYKKEDKYYKVEPVKWVVHHKDQNDNLVLVAERILLAGTTYTDIYPGGARNFLDWICFMINESLTDGFGLDAFSWQAFNYILDTNSPYEICDASKRPGTGLNSGGATTEGMVIENGTLNTSKVFSLTATEIFYDGKRIQTDYAASIYETSRHWIQSYWKAVNGNKDYYGFRRDYNIDYVHASPSGLQNAIYGFVPAITIPSSCDVFQMP